jgi:hypothetical protein
MQIVCAVSCCWPVVGLRLPLRGGVVSRQRVGISEQRSWPWRSSARPAPPLGGFARHQALHCRAIFRCRVEREWVLARPTMLEASKADQNFGVTSCSPEMTKSPPSRHFIGVGRPQGEAVTDYASGLICEWIQRARSSSLRLPSAIRNQIGTLTDSSTSGVNSKPFSSKNSAVTASDVRLFPSLNP